MSIPHPYCFACSGGIACEFHAKAEHQDFDKHGKRAFVPTDVPKLTDEPDDPFDTTETPGTYLERVSSEFKSPFRPYYDLSPELEAKRLDALTKMNPGFRTRDAILALQLNAPPPAYAPRAAAAADHPDETWQQCLRRTKKGQLLEVYSNLVTILRDKPWWRRPSIHPDSPYYGTPGGRLCFNEMTRTTHILLESLDDSRPANDDGEYPIDTGSRYTMYPVNDVWFAWVRDLIARVHRIDPDRTLLSEALADVSFHRSFHPVRDYLRSMSWDGLPRIDLLAKEILRIDSPTTLQRRMIARWLFSVVARVMKPGCKVDTVLVLHGRQGLLKSTFFKTMGGPWFCDSPMDLSNHAESCRKMTHSLIYEWSEIGKITRKKDADEIKAFITSPNDLYRALYARVAEWHPRSMVFVGTTNEQEFLTDPTGSRRFWVVPVAKPANIALLDEWRDQLWAEAVASYDQGEPWHLTEEEEADHEKDSIDFQSSDPWFAVISDYLARRTSDKDLAMTEVLGVALLLDKKDFDAMKARRAGDVLRQLGYTQVRLGGRSDRSRVWRKS